jgi:hypothetical protein
MCQAFARAVKEAQAQAAIVNLSSAAGIRGVPNRRPYAASKYGVVGITQTMALELGPLGVRVNAVVPGMIRTPMTAVMFEDPENVKRIRAAHPIGREGQPEEVAAAIAFLLSDDANFITGVALPVDGGSTAVFGHIKTTCLRLSSQLSGREPSKWSNFGANSYSRVQKPPELSVVRTVATDTAVDTGRIKASIRIASESASCRAAKRERA